VRYAEASAFLYGLAPRGVSLGLTRMRKALALRGHPERAQPVVLVAGTNGKGSVASMIAAVLQAQGYRVGLYTSPHLHRIVERFRVQGRPMPERDFARHVAGLRRFLAEPGTPALTFFEACTLLAFEHFAEAQVDIVVLEVGLGGRLDATNVVKPVVSVITSIALDHTDRLGNTLGRIAHEKAGILKRGAPLVRGPMPAAAARVIDARARRLRTRNLRIGTEVLVCSEGAYGSVRLGRESYLRLPVPLSGAYQFENLGCAVGALHLLGSRGFPWTLSALRTGLRKLRWPGRLELFPGVPDVLCDAAHNPHAAEALAGYLRACGQRYTRIVAVLGAMHDKDHAAMFSPLLPLCVAHIFATPDTPRAEPASALAARFGGEAIAEPRRALARARELAGHNGLVLIAGSIFLMGPLRALLAGERQDPPIAM
jgi:dihydrofolate synthase/folylpolyglutamate synthase